MHIAPYTELIQFCKETIAVKFYNSNIATAREQISRMS